MPRIQATDGTEIYYKEWGKGQPVVFSHGWPLSADAWDDQMLFLAERGYRCIAHDRRGHGRSDQPSEGNDMDTYADDLAALVKHPEPQGRDPRRPLDRRRRGRALHRATRHEAGGQGGVDQRDYAAHAEDAGQSRRHSHRDVRSAPRRLAHRPIAVLQGSERAVLRRESGGGQGLAGPARPVLAPGDAGGFVGVYECIKAFSETDLTADLEEDRRARRSSSTATTIRSSPSPTRRCSRPRS